MQAYSIGISGLNAAQKGLEVIGNNVANAATEGYHRQRVDLSPAYSGQVGATLLGGGVNIAGVTRLIDRLLELEILRQQSQLAYVSQESTMLSTIENTFGELSSTGTLSELIDKFFNTLQDLCAHPSEAIWQSEVATAGQNLANQFQTLGNFLTQLGTQITLEAENIIEQINTLINQIAELNDNIERIETGGGQANNLRDQRDQRIKELAKLVAVETQSRKYGVVDVSIAGIAVVAGSATTELQVGSTEDNLLGICPTGTSNYDTKVQGGRLGALLSLKNETVVRIRSELDTLASAIIQQVNQYHVQGVGSHGSFTELAGRLMVNENLSCFDQPVTNGKIYIRVTNTTTGEITRHEVEVDVSTDSLTSIAKKISEIRGLSASASSSRLQIQAEANYKFDFLPCILAEPTTSNFTGKSPPTVSVSGIYTGTENQTLTVTVIGTGSVGNGELHIEVRDGQNEVIATLNVGSGYAAGDRLDIGNGIKISLSPGDLNAGDSFQIDAFSNTDTSGLLAAAGINTFFSGSSAENIAVCSRITNSPSQIATALGAELTDNTNAARLAGLKDKTIESLSGMTPAEFYRQIVADIGQQVAVKQMRQENIETIVQNLTNKQSDISGVNINDEAAQMLVFEQMFQAMAKLLSTVQSSILTLMEIL